MQVRALLGIERQDIVFGDVPNTGVHVINMPNPTPAPSPMFGGPPVAPSHLVMEAFGLTDHLGPNRAVEALARRSGTAIVQPASDWLRARAPKLPPLAKL